MLFVSQLVSLRLTTFRLGHLVFSFANRLAPHNEHRPEEKPVRRQVNLETNSGPRS